MFHASFLSSPSSASFRDFHSRSVVREEQGKKMLPHHVPCPPLPFPILSDHPSPFLQAITADLRSGKYDAVQATPSVVLEQLASTKAAYEQVAVRAGQLRSYEELFGKMVCYGGSHQMGTYFCWKHSEASHNSWLKKMGLVKCVAALA
eukprot:1160450-Pelagomonas_calceolata.AAC.11